MKTHWKIIGWLWALPVTLLGLVLAFTLGWSVRVRAEPEDWSVHFILWGHSPLYYAFRRMNVAAMTIGCVIMYAEEGYAMRPSLVRHERVHVRQGMRYGTLNPALYLMSVLVAWAYGQDEYRGSDAEEQARYESGEEPPPEGLRPRDGIGTRGAK